jgi:hypothetical protein
MSLSIARASQLNSLTAKEIRITVTCDKTKALFKELEKPNKSNLHKANKAIAKEIRIIIYDDEVK